MALPNLIIIGSMKSGTTFLRRTIGEHPDVFMVNPTEPRFFYHDVNFNRGIDWYKEWFKDAGNSKIIAESSGLYSHCEKFPLTAKRMHDMLPNCKIIYLVRNPIERLKSHWTWDISNGRSIGNINIAIKNEKYLLEQSKYFKQISAYRTFYPEDKIKVFFMEDMVANQDLFLKNVWEFLDIDSSFIPPKEEANKNKTEGRLTDSDFLIKFRRALPRGLGSFVPSFLKNKLKTTKKPTSKLSSNSLAFISDQLKTDSTEILKYAKKPNDFWKLTN